MPDSIKCPVCHCLQTDVNEYFDQIEGDAEAYCENCDATLVISRTVKFYYDVSVKH